jgi:hypothetical protein
MPNTLDALSGGNAHEWSAHYYGTTAEKREWARTQECKYCVWELMIEWAATQ